MSDESSSEVELLVDDGIRRSELGDLAGALQSFKAALAMGSENVHINIGNTLRDMGDLEGAWAAFNAGWQQGDLDAAYNLAYSLETVGRNEAAESIYSKLAEIGYENAFVAYAWCLYEKGNLSAAIEQLQQARSARSEVAALASGILGFWLYVDGHDDSDAVQDLLRAGAEAYPSARAALGNLLAAKGLDEMARAVWAIGSDAGEPESMVPFGNYKFAAGDLEGAAILYRKAAELGDSNAADNPRSMNDS